MSVRVPGLPLAGWPKADRLAWNGLFVEGDVLDGEGAAVHWSDQTRETNRKHYVRWLGWLAQVHPDALCETPANRVTPERVTGFARDLMSGRQPRTVHAAISGLKCVIQRMEPNCDWSWLKNITNRLKSWAKGSRDLEHRLVDAQWAVATALEALRVMSHVTPKSRREQIRYRNVLIVAVLLCHPLRLRNLTDLAIGKTLLIGDGEWRIEIPSNETKSRNGIRQIVDPALVPFLQFFIRNIRPSFPGAVNGPGLWPGCKGRPMADQTIYATVMACSEDLFRVAINPHMFRTILATSQAERSPGDAIDASIHLGHSQWSTTEKHYVRASRLEASRRVAAALRELQSD